MNVGSTIPRNGNDHNRTAQVANPRAPWRTLAACLGKAKLMDRKQRDRPNAAALALCRNCPVLSTCRDWVLSLPDTLDPGGICAGMTEIARLKARRARDGGPAKTCCRCGETQPVTEFYADPRAVDGLRSECRGCAAERLKLREAARSPKPVEPIGPKICTRCKRAQDRKEFNRDRSASSGLHPWCRTCRKAHCRDYRARKRGEVV